MWDFEPYGINDLLEIRKAARTLASFELGLDDEALNELDKALKKHLKTTKRIVCLNCGEIDSVSWTSDPDEFIWDEKSQKYEPASTCPEQGYPVCTKCNDGVAAEIVGDYAVPTEDGREDLLEDLEYEDGQEDLLEDLE